MDIIKNTIFDIELDMNLFIPANIIVSKCDTFHDLHTLTYWTNLQIGYLVDAYIQ